MNCLVCNPEFRLISFIKPDILAHIYNPSRVGDGSETGHAWWSLAWLPNQFDDLQIWWEYLCQKLCWRVILKNTEYRSMYDLITSTHTHKCTHAHTRTHTTFCDKKVCLFPFYSKHYPFTLLGRATSISSWSFFWISGWVASECRAKARVLLVVS